MAFVPVPKDLNRVKTKVMFNLTKRQIICFALAAGSRCAGFLYCKTVCGTVYGCNAHGRDHASVYLLCSV